MTDTLSTDDPEPADRLPAGLLYVPVRPGPFGIAARMFRTPLGDRTAVGFTSHRRMTEVLGPDQACTRLSVPALRSLAEPLGVTTLTVDPQLAAPAVRNGDEAGPLPARPSPAAVADLVRAPSPGPVAASVPGAVPRPAPALRAAPALAKRPALAKAPALRAAPAAAAARKAERRWDPQMVGVLRVTAMAAAVEALTLWIG
ncbi:SAV_915 family protein [Actinacidiphila acidipaludis]|uniref:Uncharacterized protein n=1 Tax=Actinacidiphila acidipaludis TaxID=2873382 RepID=A0ABS7Q323_9ACTN|nr:hypothetical protein [Streptomyces acidipaludis]